MSESIESFDKTFQPMGKLPRLSDNDSAENHSGDPEQLAVVGNLFALGKPPLVLSVAQATVRLGRLWACFDMD